MPELPSQHPSKNSNHLVLIHHSRPNSNDSAARKCTLPFHGMLAVFLSQYPPFLPCIIVMHIYMTLFPLWDWKLFDGGIWMWVTFAFSHPRPLYWQVLRQWLLNIWTSLVNAISHTHIHVHIDTCDLQLPPSPLLLMGVYPFCVAHLLDIWVRVKKNKQTGFLSISQKAHRGKIHIWSGAKNEYIWSYFSIPVFTILWEERGGNKLLEMYNFSFPRIGNRHDSERLVDVNLFTKFNS